MHLSRSVEFNLCKIIILLILLISKGQFPKIRLNIFTYFKLNLYEASSWMTSSVHSLEIGKKAFRRPRRWCTFSKNFNEHFLFIFNWLKAESVRKLSTLWPYIYPSSTFKFYNFWKFQKFKIEVCMQFWQKTFLCKNTRFRY